MVTTLTFHNGKTFSVKHNINPNFREHQEHIDASRTKDNVILKAESLKEAYAKLFNDSLQKYNKQQIEKGHPERQINSYLKHIEKSQTHNTAYEIIVQIGDKDTIISKEKQAQVLTEYAKGFQERNPNLYLFCAAIHMDEKSPHLHLDYIPIAYDCKRGLEAQNSLEKALNQQGYKSKDKGHTAQMKWTQGEREILTSLCKKHDIEITHLHENREHLTKENYILLDNNRQLEKANRNLQATHENLSREYDGLKKIMKIRYTIPTPDGRGIHKNYHSDKQVTEIINHLRAEMAQDRAEYLQVLDKACDYDRAIASRDRAREDLRYANERADIFEHMLESENPRHEYEKYLLEHDFIPDRINKRDVDLTIDR